MCFAISPDPLVVFMGVRRMTAVRFGIRTERWSGPREATVTAQNCSGHLDAVQARGRQLHDLGWQRRVPEIRGEPLAVASAQRRNSTICALRARSPGLS